MTDTSSWNFTPDHKSFPDYYKKEGELNGIFSPEDALADELPEQVAAAIKNPRNNWVNQILLFLLKMISYIGERISQVLHLIVALGALVWRLLRSGFILYALYCTGLQTLHIVPPGPIQRSISNGTLVTTGAALREAPWEVIAQRTVASIGVDFLHVRPEAEDQNKVTMELCDRTSKVEGAELADALFTYCRDEKEAEAGLVRLDAKKKGTISSIEIINQKGWPLIEPGWFTLQLLSWANSRMRLKQILISYSEALSSLADQCGWSFIKVQQSQKSLQALLDMLRKEIVAVSAEEESRLASIASLIFSRSRSTQRLRYLGGLKETERLASTVKEGKAKVLSNLERTQSNILEFNEQAQVATHRTE